MTQEKEVQEEVQTVELQPIDVDSFTLQDYEDFEEVTGMPWEGGLTLPVLRDAKGNPIRDEKNRPVKASMPPAKVLSVLIWLSQRKHDENYTLADAKKIRPSEVVWNQEEDSPGK